MRCPAWPCQHQRPCRTARWSFWSSSRRLARLEMPPATPVQTHQPRLTQAAEAAQKDGVTTLAGAAAPSSSASSSSVVDPFDPAHLDSRLVVTAVEPKVRMSPRLDSPPFRPQSTSSHPLSRSLAHSLSRSLALSLSLFLITKHTLVLNKFNTVEGHALLVTDAFQVRRWPAWKCVNALVLAHFQAHQLPVLLTYAFQVRGWPAWKCPQPPLHRSHPDTPTSPLPGPGQPTDV